MEPIKMVVMSETQARITRELVVREIKELRKSRAISKEDHARLRWLQMLAEDLEWSEGDER